MLRRLAFRTLIIALATRLGLSTAVVFGVTLIGGSPKAFAGMAMWWHDPLAVVLPFAFAIPVTAVIGALHPVRVRFPPIAPDS